MSHKFKVGDTLQSVVAAEYTYLVRSVSDENYILQIRRNGVDFGMADVKHYMAEQTCELVPKCITGDKSRTSLKSGESPPDVFRKITRELSL